MNIEDIFIADTGGINTLVYLAWDSEKFAISGRCEEEGIGILWRNHADEIIAHIQQNKPMNDKTERTGMQPFGQHLRQLRKAKGISQRDLAAQIGIDFSYLSKIETGSLEFLPSEAVILQIAQVLEVDGNELVCLAGKMPPRLKDMMEDNPLLTELIHVLSQRVLPDETYRKMIEMAREVKEV
jgi:transcriptional regulator with XRE-family HTH domain